MSIESVELEVGPHMDQWGEIEECISTDWGGRNVHLLPQSASSNGLTTRFDVWLKESRVREEYSTCKLFWGYTNPEEKKAIQFEIDVLRHAIHCQSKEQEDREVKILENFARGFPLTGSIGALVIKRDYVNAAINSAIYILVLKENVTMTLLEFKQLLKERGAEYSDAHFFHHWEEIKKNEQDLIMRGIIIEGDNSRHYNGNPHYTENPHYTRPLI